MRDEGVVETAMAELAVSGRKKLFLLAHNVHYKRVDKKRYRLVKVDSHFGL